MAGEERRWRASRVRVPMLGQSRWGAREEVPPPSPLLPKCCSTLGEGQRFRRSVRPSDGDPARAGWWWWREVAAQGGGKSGCERGFIRGVPPGIGMSRFLEITMAIGLALLGLLAFLLGCPGTFAEPQNSERAAKCSLTGSWKNDLASTMEINSVSNTGVFSGVYKTAVSDSGLPIRPSSLVGVQHLGDQPVFGFTVNWSFDGSTAVFAGQCLVDENGKEQLKTTWLLRGKVGSIAEDWRATRIGTDTFDRIK